MGYIKRASDKIPQPPASDAAVDRFVSFIRQLGMKVDRETAKNMQINGKCAADFEENDYGNKKPDSQ